jgi:hypothetical protein
MAKLSGWVSAEEHIRLLQANPEYMRMRAEQERDLAERKVQLKVAQAPLLADLAVLGIEVQSVWDLVNTSSPYHDAIPLLLEHLRRPYPNVIREGIARALAVPATRKIGWSVLVDEFRKTEATNEQVKDGLAVALAGASDDSVIQELIGLAKDKRNGCSRILLLAGIRRSKRLEAKQAIDELAEDPDLAKEIKSWRRNRRAGGTGPHPVK